MVTSFLRIRSRFCSQNFEFVRVFSMLCCELPVLYDDNKITKGGIWVTIMKASCIISFKPHVCARLNSIFLACGCGSLLVYLFDVFSRMLARKTQIVFSFQKLRAAQRLSPSTSTLQRPNTTCGHSLAMDMKLIPWI